MAKVLVFQANPRDTSRLRLNDKLRAIQKSAEEVGQGSLEIKFLGAVRKTDLQSSLILYLPDIVHFTGHATKSSELVLEDDTGGSTILEG